MSSRYWKVIYENTSEEDNRSIFKNLKKITNIKELILHRNEETFEINIAIEFAKNKELDIENCTKQALFFEDYKVWVNFCKSDPSYMNYIPKKSEKETTQKETKNQKSVDELIEYNDLKMENS